VDSGFKEMPYTFVSPNDPTVESCLQVASSLPYPFFESCTLTRGGLHRQQFSLASDFPSSNLLVRNPAGEPARSLYLTNDLVRAVLSMNDYRRIRLMTAGTKVFTRQESGFGHGGAGGGEERIEKVPRFRLLNEGLPVLLPYIKPESIIDTDLRALRRLLETYYPLLNAFDEAFQRVVGSKRTYKFYVLFLSFSPYGSILKKVVLELLAQGSHVVRFKQGDIDGASCVLIRHPSFCEISF
jgi:multisite-specific tRNA:(cytosine-C5)-methyltransferase